ncbi:MAG: hypothetical protein WD024_06825 [Bacillota bacterium]
MLRRAVIQALKAVALLGGRAYEAFLAPSDVGKPYATVKIPDVIGDPVIGYAGTQPVEIYLYADPYSFIPLDDVEAAVMAALNRQDVVDAMTGHLFHVEWTPGGGDFADDVKRLIGRLVRFEAAVVHEPGGG